MIRPLCFLPLLFVAVPGSSQPSEAPALRSGRGVLAVAGSEVTSTLPAGVTISAITPAGPRFDWLAAGTEGETRLVVIGGEGDQHRRLAPPRETAATVAEPVPVADERGRLVGLAWLAGRDRDRLAVRFAAWEGDGWGRPVTVAPAGPGSQLALAAAANGGTVVLAWSAFDGQDDEILTSRRSRGRFEPPRRIEPDDAVPDVTPALLADGDGFLLVWSGFDAGEYRLFSSRLRGERWSAASALGPPGSLFPSLAAGEKGPLLLYRDVHARGWSVLELDSTGRTVNRALFVAGPDAAPVLRGARRDGVRLFARGREVTLGWEIQP